MSVIRTEASSAISGLLQHLEALSLGSLSWWKGTVGTILSPQGARKVGTFLSLACEALGPAVFEAALWASPLCEPLS